VNWTFEKLLIDRSEIEPSAWYRDRFWAPEIHKIQGRYYLLVNCAYAAGTGYLDSMGGLVAIADDLMGPYTVLTESKPFAFGNDLSFFEDQDGRVYAFWNGRKEILAAEVDMEEMHPIGEPVIILSSTRGTWDSIGVEGPYVIRHEDEYYLIYSSWTRGYEIGYARAPGPLGPWVKGSNNPVYGAQNPVACEQKGMEYTGNPDLPFEAVGHGQIFTGPDGGLWISCHAIEKGQPPFLCIDPIAFDKNGDILRREPSYTPQSVSIP
jgi:beta-xylosidase